jgi:flavin reductase (DIM6/NTAB) family NADH-FMN oxidoreductase RutF
VVGSDPTVLALALYPAWTSTSNILRTQTFTVSVVSSEYVNAIWIVGEKYSGIDLRGDADKFKASGLHAARPFEEYPECVAEAISVLACRVTATFTEESDHVVFFARAERGACRGSFDIEGVLRDQDVGVPMQVSGSVFARSVPTAPPDQALQDLVDARLEYPRN